MQKFLLIFLYFFMLLSLLSETAHSVEGKVVRVVDGDTIHVQLPDREIVKIRLYGIDCPEKMQQSGKAATQFLHGLLSGQQVFVDVVTRDRYGRTVGVVWYEGLNVNAGLLENGHAWVYGQYCQQQFCADWLELQQDARSQKNGLWQHASPMPPWEYRRAEKTHRSSQEAKKIVSIAYRGNSKSFVLHRPDCRYFSCKNCTVQFSNREAAIQAGFRPCNICRP